MSILKDIDNIIGWMAGADIKPKQKVVTRKSYVQPKVTLNNTNKPHLYRPNTFEYYIGQTKAKHILKSFISGTKKLNKIFPHVLIHGSAGCGKTTLARIIANELNIPFVEGLAGDLDLNSLAELHKQAQNGILFLDEIHRMNRDTAEIFYSIMEDFTYGGQSVPPLTLIGATTEVGEIIKNRKPFYDRFKIIIELEPYTTQDMFEIIKRYTYKTYSNNNINENNLKVIAQNARNTPRHAIRLTDYLYYSEESIDNVLSNNNIIADGYTNKDFKLLEYLYNNKKPVGIDTISLYLNTSQENYNYDIEPYLIQQGVITRTARGRIISQIGEQVYFQLKKINDDRINKLANNSVY